MAEDTLSGHLAHTGPRRAVVVTPSVQVGAGSAVCGVIVSPSDTVSTSFRGGWQPIDLLIGKVKPADEAPSAAESLSRLLK